MDGDSGVCSRSIGVVTSASDALWRRNFYFWVILRLWAASPCNVTYLVSFLLLRTLVAFSTAFNFVAMRSSAASPFMSTGHGVALTGRLYFDVSTHGVFVFVLIF